MGAARPAAVAAPDPRAAFHGGTAKYQGAPGLKDALAIEVDRIVPDPDQPRKEFDPEALDDLADEPRRPGASSSRSGSGGTRPGEWVIIAGERRYRAALLAGPADARRASRPRGPLTPDEILEDQLMENCIREDLKPIEQARAFRALHRPPGMVLSPARRAALNLSSAPSPGPWRCSTLPSDLPGAGRRGHRPGVGRGRGRQDRGRRDPARDRRQDRGRGDDEGRGRARGPAGHQPGPEIRDSKGQGGGPRPMKPRTFRTPAGKVVVEPKRGPGPDPIRAALEDALAQLGAERMKRRRPPEDGVPGTSRLSHRIPGRTWESRTTLGCPKSTWASPGGWASGTKTSADRSLRAATATFTMVRPP